MNAKSFIFAAAVCLVAGPALAAESPEASVAASAATVSGGASAAASASSPTLPEQSAASPTPRDEAKAGAVDFVKNYRTTLAVQLDQYKN